MKFGVQLFSARQYLQTDEGIEKAFAISKEIGYECVQYSGAPNGGDFNPEFLKKMIDKYEMPVNLTHISYDKFKNNLNEEIAKHKQIGCFNIGLGMLPGECLKDKNRFFQFIDEIKSISETISDAGCKFFYHNHSIDFVQTEPGVTLLDYMFENVPEMHITLDVHWVQRGGVAVLDAIEKYKGRIECVHLKDFKITPDWEEKFAPVGEGNLNWSKIIPAFEKAGTQFAFVEQDDAADYGDPFDCLRTSCANIKKLGF